MDMNAYAVPTGDTFADIKGFALLWNPPPPTEVNHYLIRCFSLRGMAFVETVWCFFPCHHVDTQRKDKWLITNRPTCYLLGCLSLVLSKLPASQPKHKGGEISKCLIIQGNLITIEKCLSPEGTGCDGSTRLASRRLTGWKLDELHKKCGLISLWLMLTGGNY